MSIFKVRRAMSITFFGALCLVAVLLSGCDAAQEESAADGADVFIKAEPAVDAVLDRHPRTLRIYLKQLPNVAGSTVQLFGPNGEVSLSGLHTMGADDLMIEIDDHPLANGEYTVNWTARFGDDPMEYKGNYRFTVAVED